MAKFSGTYEMMFALEVVRRVLEKAFQGQGGWVHQFDGATSGDGCGKPRHAVKIKGWFRIDNQAIKFSSEFFINIQDPRGGFVANGALGVLNLIDSNKNTAEYSFAKYVGQDLSVTLRSGRWLKFTDFATAY